MPRPVVTAINRARSQKKTFPKAQSSVRSRFCLSSVKVGTKAGVMAPSPVSRRKRLGMVKAMVKASALLPVPR